VLKGHDVLKAATHVFNRYQHDSANTKSSGLGLSIARSIVDLYRMELTYHYDSRHVFTLQLK
jgi:K+-sensing histidine kinase KdpD